MASYTKNNLTITEFKGSGPLSCEYILASFDCSVEPENLRKLFDKLYLFENGLVNDKVNDDVGKLSVGREGVTVFKHHEAELVLRHYRRGGMMRHVVKERYCWQGLEKTRAFGELDVLQRLYGSNVDVCQPFAARVQRSGLVYKASLITHLVPAATPLSAALANRPLSTAVWQNVGQAIHAMHAKGVFHADLNAHNILLANNKVVLIDFDKARDKNTLSKLSAQEADSWQEANLGRLLRSLDKLKRLNNIYFESRDWKVLRHAYFN